MKGWIKLHRRLLTNPIIMKDSDHFALWVYILLSATHDNIDVIFKKKRTTLKSGEFTTGRKKISKDLSINEYKVHRMLKWFENEQQITQRTDMQCRLIKVVNWGSYQEDAQRNAQQVHNDCTTIAQRLHTKQECNNVKNEKNVIVSRVNFKIPDRKEVEIYFSDKGSVLDIANDFYDYYESNGWKVGKNPMKSWTSAASRWMRNNQNGGAGVGLSDNMKAMMTIKTVNHQKHERDVDEVLKELL